MSRSTKTKVRVLAKTAKTASTAAARRAEDLLALIARRKLRIVEDFFDIGVALKELRDKKHYAALGFASFEALLAGRKVLGDTQAYKLIKVVEAFPNREEVIAIGFEKAFALIAYAAATPVTDFPRLLAQTGIRGKAMRELSVRDIDDETKKVRARVKATKPSSPEERRRRSAASAFASRLRGLGLRRIDVAIEHGDIVARVALEHLERWLSEAGRA